MDSLLKPDFSCLQDCAFLCGNSTDLQPLLRLRHLLQRHSLPEYFAVGSGLSAATFVSASLGKPVGEHADVVEFIRDVDRKLTWINSRGVQLSRVGHPIPFALPRNDSFRGGLPADLFDEKGWRDYENQFGGDRRGCAWGVEILFLREHAGENDLIRVVHVSAEALSALWTLSGHGQICPRIVVSIQTGQLELPEGPLERLLGRFESLPWLWVRGRWAQGIWPPFFAPSWRDEARMLMGGRFSHEVQRYGHWNGCLGVYTDLPATQFRLQSRSLVRAYTTQPIAHLLAEAAEFGGRGRKVRVVHAPLTPDDDGRIKIATKRIRRKWQDEGYDVSRIKAWEDFGIKSDDTLSRALTVLECSPWRLNHYAIVPIGYEDEGYRVVEFAGRRGAQVRVDVHFTDALDFADLRGWPHGMRQSPAACSGN
jgi:hypothetical protein